MTRGAYARATWAVLALVALVALPWVGNAYWLTLGISMLMYGVLATSWALFSGPTHYISLATAAFYGLGAYGVGMGIEAMPFPVLVLLCGVAGTVLACLVGLATLRLSGVYFVIFTLGLAEFIRQVVTWIQNNFTGSRGMYVLTDLTDIHIYYELLALFVVVLAFGMWLVRSRLGFALRVIGSDETVAAHVGIHSARAKILLFMFSGAVAAITGAIMAPRLSYIEPSMAFSPDLSFQVVIMALLGGVHKLWGPLLGVIPFTLLWEFIAAVMPTQTVLLLGLAFLIIVYFIPNGIAGWLTVWAKRGQRED
jgi:branched-chain amino acid transport system permease protein